MTAAEDRLAAAAEELINAMDIARTLIDAGRVEQADFRRVQAAIIEYDEARETLMADHADDGRAEQIAAEEAAIATRKAEIEVQAAEERAEYERLAVEREDRER